MDARAQATPSPSTDSSSDNEADGEIERLRALVQERRALLERMTHEKRIYEDVLFWGQDRLDFLSRTIEENN